MKNILLIMAVFSVSVMMAQEFPIATGMYSQTYPSAIFANGVYYNAFLDKSSGSYNYGFHGKFVEPDGNVLSQDIEIIPPVCNLSFMHEIIYGQENYLFVWARGVTLYDRDAYGQIVGDDGNPTGGFFPVSIGNQESTSFIEAAFDGENYLVVWQEGLPNNGSAIRAQFVNQSGQLIGDNFSVRPDGIGEEVDQIYPDVEFDGEKYLVVWDDDRNANRDIYGQFVSVEGDFIGADIKITENISDQLLVQLAFGGQRFFAVWADERLSSNDHSIYGQLIETDGSLLGENLVVSPQANSEGRSWPDVSAGNGEFLVVWDQEWLDYTAGMVGSHNLEKQKYEAAGIPLPRPTVWYDVYARKISSQGEYLSDEMAICTAAFHQQDCNVISDGTDFLVSWSDSRNNNQYYDIYGFIVEGSGLPEPPVVNPGEINFVSVNQFIEGGEGFSVYNPNSFPIDIDTITFETSGFNVWYLNETPSFPLSVDADSTIELTVNLLLPAGKSRVKAIETDTLIVKALDSDHKILLNIEEALLDTLHIAKMEFLKDSIYFENVEHAYDGLTFEMVNRHFPGIYISSVHISGSYGLWDVIPEEVLPYTISFRDTFQFTVVSMLPVQPDFDFGPDDIGIDTIWFDSWMPDEYYFPVYYETAIIDSIWTDVGEPESPAGISFYPNPANAFLDINLPEGHVYRMIQLIDFCGVLKKEREIRLQERNVELDVQGLKSGIYILRFVSDAGSYHEKVIITP